MEQENNISSEEIRKAARSGFICKEFGHSWIEINPATNPVTNPDFSNHTRQCRLCNKITQKKIIWEDKIMPNLPDV